MKISARNQLEGRVVAIEAGPINAKVVIDAGGQTITSIISLDALEELGIKEGATVTALFKASSVLLMA
ncbi:molybdenum-pterin binding domain-containing protein [Paenibacillus sophorae]|uniref:Molybdenum-pterin binding domain-containing protein n=1 Tax=Paenibacillus sophorae TaxID=1333845 RepID=A0A1H8TAP0_9BACL|nr:TOBE domain-containing protein [Paenibacillus sophorae]QWU17171.1 TOBE domain-containing protein [Paenibacillus sophorae]SEO87962.1 molybdenum-pterin binding domain-containing protein [Paenibacillus sophorae]